MKKRVISIVLSLSMLLGLSACSIDDVFTSNEMTIYTEDNFNEIADDIIDSLYELADDDEFIDLMISTDDAKDIVSEFADTEIDDDEEMMVIYTEDSDKFLKAMHANEIKNISSVSKNKLLHSFTAFMLSKLRDDEDVKYMLATNVLQVSKSFVAGNFEDQIWILPTDDESTFLYVDFEEAGDNVMSVTAGFIYTSDGKEDIVETVDYYFDIEYKDIEL